MNIRPAVSMSQSKPMQPAPQFAARYKLNGEAVTSITGATGTTVSFAPEFVAPALQATGLGSWAPALLANPVVAGLVTSLGGNVTARIGSDLLIKTQERSPREPQEVSAEPKAEEKKSEPVQS